MKTSWFSVGAVFAGVAASSCCLGPLLFSLGVGGLGFLARLEPYRPILILAVIGLLAFAFHRTYWRSLTGKDCCPPARRRAQRIFFWAAVVLALGGIFFPYLLSLFA